MTRAPSTPPTPTLPWPPQPPLQVLYRLPVFHDQFMADMADAEAGAGAAGAEGGAALTGALRSAFQTLAAAEAERDAGGGAAATRTPEWRKSVLEGVAEVRDLTTPDGASEAVEAMLSAIDQALAMDAAGESSPAQPATQAAASRLVDSTGKDAEWVSPPAKLTSGRSCVHSVFGVDIHERAVCQHCKGRSEKVEYSRLVAHAPVTRIKQVADDNPGAHFERLWKFATSTYLPCAAKCRDLPQALKVGSTASATPLQRPGSHRGPLLAAAAAVAAVPCMVKRTLSQCRPTVVALALSWPTKPTQSFLSTIWDLLFPRLCLQYFFDSIELPGQWFVGGLVVDARFVGVRCVVG